MNHNLKYIFFGTPEFAAIILEKLIKAGWPPIAVVCNPDRPVGRKKIITSPATKILAQKYGIKIYQPENLEFGIWNLEFKKIKNEIFDFFMVAAYAKIIPKEILEIPRLGAIGVHPSLLPKYRGPSPIQSVILNGEDETGVTLFLIDEKVDHGSILAKSEIRNSKSETYESLLKKLAEIGGNLLIETLPKFLKGEITPLPQDETKATYTKKFITEDSYVDLQKDEPILIERKIRALNPEPGVWTIQNGKRMKILEAELTPENKLKLKKIQFEGKKPRTLL
jgi:methionyl-tRNA formyltransferase